MSQYNLDRIFQPRCVTVVGASESSGSIGNALMKNLIEGGFQGKLLPVNPKYPTVHGMSAVGSVSALETGVDLAVIATPIHTVPDIVRECVEKKIAGAIVISAGGKEVGEKGKKSRSGYTPRPMPAGFLSWGRTAWASSDPAQTSTPASHPKCPMSAIWPLSPRAEPSARPF